MAGSAPTPQDLAAHASFVHRLARSLLFDEHRAADVAQSALLGALQRPGPRRTLRRWLAGAVRNRAKMEWRSAARRRTHEERAPKPGAAPATADVAAELEIQRRLVDVVAALPEPSRTAIVWRFFHNKPPRRMARDWKVPVETAKTRLRRALQSLRNALDDAYGERRTWCFALAPALMAHPLTAAVGAAGGGTKLALGGLAMNTTTKLVAASLVAVTATGVGIHLQSSDEETPVARVRDEPSPAGTVPDSGAPRSPDARKPDASPVTALGIEKPDRAEEPDPTGVDPTAEELKREARVNLEKLRRLRDLQKMEAVTADLEKKLQALMANRARPPKKPDETTRKYLVALGKDYLALEDGADRRALLARLLEVHKDYVRRTGDLSRLAFLAEVVEKHGSEADRTAVIQALRSHPHPKVAAALVVWTNHPDPKARRYAVVALGSMTDQESRRLVRSPLRDLMGHREPSIRSAAIQSFARIANEPGDAEILVDTLRYEHDPNTVLGVVMGFRRLDPKRGPGRLRQALKTAAPKTRPVLKQVLEQLLGPHYEKMVAPSER